MKLGYSIALSFVAPIALGGLFIAVYEWRSAAVLVETERIPGGFMSECYQYSNSAHAMGATLEEAEKNCIDNLPVRKTVYK